MAPIGRSLWGMRLRLFGMLPRTVAPGEDAERADDGLGDWAMPSMRSCRGVQLAHVGQVMTCTSETCPDVEAKHVVSFRCVVMANPCPLCGARAWGQ